MVQSGASKNSFKLFMYSTIKTMTVVSFLNLKLCLYAIFEIE